MIVFALGFVCGAYVLQQQAALPSLYAALLLLPVLTALLWVYRLQTKLAWVLQLSSLFIFSCVVGFFYAALLAQLRLTDALPEGWEKQPVKIVGVVASLPERTERGERFTFDVERVFTENAIVSNSVIPRHIALSYYADNRDSTNSNDSSTLRPDQSSGSNIESQAAEPKAGTFHAGERWQLTVSLKRPHGTYNPHGYDFEAWALAENIRAVGNIRNKSGLKKLDEFVWEPGYFIESCREKIAFKIEKVLAGQPYAGVVVALVVGDDSQIRRQDWDIFLHTGINHLMSISGLHITMLAGLAFTITAFAWRRIPPLVSRFPTQRAATILAMLTAFVYACLAGLSVPTQRTLIMLFTFAGALLLGRKLAVTHVLAIALVLVVMFDPWAVIAPGFWLSFSAVGLITYVTVNRFKSGHWLSEAVRTQWAITLGLLPFLILMFGQTSLVAPLANAVAIPLISLVVVPLAIMGAVLPVDFVLQAAHKVFEICMLGLNWLANSSYSIWQQAAPPIYLIALALLGALWWLLPRGFPQRWLGALLLLPMLSFSLANLKTGEMQVTVLDVGQGLSVVIKTAKHTFLYDTGPSYNSQSDAGRQIVLPYLRGEGVRRLDGMMVSHNDNDHSGGANSILSNMQVSWLASSYPFTLPPQPLTPALNLIQCKAGQHWTSDSVHFELLSPSATTYNDETIKDNNRSCVLKVTSAYGSLLLTGDIELSAEHNLLNAEMTALKSDVLIVPHHGSKTSSSPDFIKAIGAKHIVFTVGYLNRFNHPKLQVVKRYRQSDAVLYRSDYSGAITIDFKQNNIIAPQAWRQQHPRYWQDKFPDQW